jgi:hypothetical protein
VIQMDSVRTLAPSAPNRRLSSCRCLLPILAACLFALGHADPAVAQDYDKVIIFDGVTAGSTFEGGALVETWAGSKKKDDEKVTFYPGISRLFVRADPTRTATDAINGATLARIIKPVAGSNVVFGPGTTPLWNPPKITADDAPTHSNHNVSTAKVDVFSEAVLVANINGPGGRPKANVFLNAVTANLTGAATAGAPKDGDMYHSADSWAGVFVENKKTFTKMLGSPDPFAFAGVNKVGFAGTTDVSGGKAQRYIDPYFMIVNDLTTGESTINEIMSETITATGADIFIDNTGIRLGVNRLNPLSSVSFQFSSETPWVTNPYHYGATLDNSGLTLDGDIFPLSGWTTTMTSDRIDAFYSFGAGGAPLDFANVVPAASLFTLGHEYSYDVGAGGGAFSIAAVPEPSALFPFVVTAAVVVGLRRRRSILGRRRA